MVHWLKQTRFQNTLKKIFYQRSKRKYSQHYNYLIQKLIYYSQTLTNLDQQFQCFGILDIGKEN